MPVIGVTGGIASGKSTVTRLLAAYLGEKPAIETQVFSADECSHALLEKNGQVAAEIVAAFGYGVLNENEQINRTSLRAIVFSNEERRRQLEAILHPRIRESWLELAKEFRVPGKYLVAEIPLLYETNSDNHLDCVVVVEAGTQVQIERLSSKRDWSLEIARRVIDAQMSADEKMRRADIFILNHHTEKLMALQVELAATTLFMRYA